GRVVRDGEGRFSRIVEAKDATAGERAIGEINSGLYAFDRAVLERQLPRLTADNAQGEYYLTDVLGLAVREEVPVVAIPVEDPNEVLGVNSRAELAEVDALLRRRAARAAMAAGATLIRPETITLDDGVTFGADAVVEPFVTITGASSVGAGSRIGQGCVVSSSTIGANVVVRPYCVVEKAVIGDGAVVGPFARLREGTDLGEGVQVGNFVETKKARLAKGAKANHLTYLGDCSVGERTNVGAGVITCNYDGYGKHSTDIGAGVFVGSDVQLVAPVTIGDGAVIGAGSTITKDVPADALATSRVPQKTIEGGGAKYRERKLAAKARKEQP
ncbi:MAG: bifunctional UDP-N-acetylglucosamine diphosphorylase/glucosamine-1-phosphate N-acetyltransferase GlmU, partial [Thermoanaerobaculia bacterium]|nr:bifunctional UDP-N-acetylglucosamine diphosphorylase/glucosamine-1-phosphate N-acetyltransferase GlmU [Thermoanaerobaculia bacterium]